MQRGLPALPTAQAQPGKGRIAHPSPPNARNRRALCAPSGDGPTRAAAPAMAPMKAGKPLNDKGTHPGQRRHGRPAASSTKSGTSTSRERDGALLTESAQGSLTVLVPCPAACVAEAVCSTPLLITEPYHHERRGSTGMIAEPFVRLDRSSPASVPLNRPRRGSDGHVTVRLWRSRITLTTHPARCQGRWRSAAVWL